VQAPLPHQTHNSVHYPIDIYRYKRVSFGLSGGPLYFQYTIRNIVFHGLVTDKCLVYINDAIILGKTEQKHNAKLEDFWRVSGNTKSIQVPAKFEFGHIQVKYLGHQIDASGVYITDERKQHRANIQLPISVGELHSSVGLANFFRVFISRD